jgi:uncharacterized protein (DUF1684 family)
MLFIFAAKKMRTALIILLTLGFLSCVQDNLTPYQQEIKAYRTEYLQSFLNTERGPLEQEDLRDLRFYQADSTFAVSAEYTLLNDEPWTDFPTSAGKTKAYRKYARLEFSMGGKAEELFVFESKQLQDSDEYRDYLFLPFTDLTSGEQTYGGGRYLDLNRNDFTGGRVVIDFNKSYNPWCAYSDGFNCPVPPRENDLEMAVTAGEMLFGGEYKSLSKNDNH